MPIQSYNRAEKTVVQKCGGCGVVRTLKLSDLVPVSKTHALTCPPCVCNSIEFLQVPKDVLDPRFHGTEFHQHRERVRAIYNGITKE